AALKRLEKENSALKELLAEKELELKFKDELLMAVTKALRIAEVPKSSYYYQPKGARKGKPVSTHTLKRNELVDNQVVVEEINRILSEEFIDYGYVRTTEALKRLGYQINKKKVYRLMKEDHLLYPKIKRRVSKR